MSPLVRDPRPGYPFPVGPLPDHLTATAVGKRRISKDVVAEHQRLRVLTAATEVFARRGYQSATVDQIVGAARIGVGSFYVLFEGKEDCFLRLYDLIVAEAEERIAAAAAGEGRWPDRVRAAPSRRLRSRRRLSPAWPGAFTSGWPSAARSWSGSCCPRWRTSSSPRIS